MLPGTWSLVAALLLVVAGGLVEWRTGNIPNWLTLPALAAGLVVGLVDHRGAEHVAAFVGATVVCLVAWLAGGMGGGAMKMAVAVSALLGGMPALRFLAGFGLLWGLRLWPVRGACVEVRSSPFMLVALLGQAGVAWWLYGRLL